MNPRPHESPHAHGAGDEQHRDPRQELRAMEKVARLLCSHIRHLVSAARARSALDCREGRLQEEAFTERRSQVMQLLDAPLQGSEESRLARLSRLIKALEFSRAYFRKV